MKDEARLHINQVRFLISGPSFHRQNSLLSQVELRKAAAQKKKKETLETLVINISLGEEENFGIKLENDGTCPLLIVDAKKSCQEKFRGFHALFFSSFHQFDA